MEISFVTHRFTKRRLAASSADNIREKLLLSGIIGRKKWEDLLARESCQYFKLD